MAEVLTKLTVTFPDASARHSPVSINDWWFTVFGADGGELETNSATITNAVQAFYDTAVPSPPVGAAGKVAVDSWMAHSVHAGVTFRGVAIDPTTGHELAGTVVESVRDLSFPGRPDVVSLPYECAVCCSFTALTTGLTGRHKARARGRVFLGPLTFEAVSNSDIDEGPSVSIFYMDVIAQAHQRLSTAVAAIGTSPSCAQVIYSRVDRTPRVLNGAYVDGEFDTQRRRSGLTMALSQRNAWSV